MKYLDSYCENLNDKVRQGKVDRIIRTGTARSIG